VSIPFEYYTPKSHQGFVVQVAQQFQVGGVNFNVAPQDGFEWKDSETFVWQGEELSIFDSRFRHNLGRPDIGFKDKLEVNDPYHTFRTSYPVITSGGGTHNNTEHILYSGQDYLRCRHLAGNLTGVYTSPVFDIGAAEGQNRHLIYLTGQDPSEPDILIVGEGTTWADKFPTPTTWIGGEATTKSWGEIFDLDAAPSVSIRMYYGIGGEATTKSWGEIFDLDAAPSVSIRMYYGTTSPPTSYVDRMEILSAIIPGSVSAVNRYFQIRITITDPNENVFAYIEAFDLKFCTYS
jgi:hypothetical protein